MNKVIFYPETTIPFIAEEAKFAIVFAASSGARLMIAYPDHSPFSGAFFEPILPSFKDAPIAQSVEANVKPLKFSLSDTIPHTLVIGESKAISKLQAVKQEIDKLTAEFQAKVAQVFQST